MTMTTNTVAPRYQARVRTEAGWSPWVYAEDVPAAPPGHVIFYEDLEVLEIQRRKATEDPDILDLIEQKVTGKLDAFMRDQWLGAIGAPASPNIFERVSSAHLRKQMKEAERQETYSAVDGYGDF